MKDFKRNSDQGKEAKESAEEQARLVAKQREAQKIQESLKRLEQKKQLAKQERASSEAKDEPKEQPRDGAKEQPKDEAKDQPKGEVKQHPKNESKEHPRDEAQEQPKRESKEQPKDEAKEQPRVEAKDEPKDETKEQPKDDTAEQPKSETGEQPKREAEEQPKDEAKERPKREAGEQPKDDAEEQPKDAGKEQLKREAGDQPKSESKEQPKDETKEQPKDDTEEQPKREAGDQPRREAGEEPKRETEDRPKREADAQPKDAAKEQPKRDTEEQPKDDTEEQPKDDTEEQPKRETGELPKREADAQPKDAAKEQPKREADEQPKRDTEDEPKRETKEQLKDETKDEPKDEANDEPKEQRKDEANEQPKGEPKEQPKDKAKEQPKDEAKEQPKSEAEEQHKGRAEEQPGREAQIGDEAQNDSNKGPDNRHKDRDDESPEEEVEKSDDSTRVEDVRPEVTSTPTDIEDSRQTRRKQQSSDSAEPVMEMAGPERSKPKAEETSSLERSREDSELPDNEKHDSSARRTEGKRPISSETQPKSGSKGVFGQSEGVFGQSKGLFSKVDGVLDRTPSEVKPSVEKRTANPSQQEIPVRQTDESSHLGGDNQDQTTARQDFSVGNESAEPGQAQGESPDSVSTTEASEPNSDTTAEGTADESGSSPEATEEITNSQTSESSKTTDTTVPQDPSDKDDVEVVAENQGKQPDVLPDLSAEQGPEEQANVNPADENGILNQQDGPIAETEQPPAEDHKNLAGDATTTQENGEESAGVSPLAKEITGDTAEAMHGANADNAPVSTAGNESAEPDQAQGESLDSSSTTEAPEPKCDTTAEGTADESGTLNQQDEPLSETEPPPTEEQKNLTGRETNEQNASEAQPTPASEILGEPTPSKTGAAPYSSPENTVEKNPATTTQEADSTKAADSPQDAGPNSVPIPEEQDKQTDTQTEDSAKPELAEKVTPTSATESYTVNGNLEPVSENETSTFESPAGKEIEKSIPEEETPTSGDNTTDEPQSASDLTTDPQPAVEKSIESGDQQEILQSGNKNPEDIKVPADDGLGELTDSVTHPSTIQTTDKNHNPLSESENHSNTPDAINAPIEASPAQYSPLDTVYPEDERLLREQFDSKLNDPNTPHTLQESASSLPRELREIIETNAALLGCDKSGSTDTKSALERIAADPDTSDDDRLLINTLVESNGTRLSTCRLQLMSGIEAKGKYTKHPPSISLDAFMSREDLCKILIHEAAHDVLSRKINDYNRNLYGKLTKLDRLAIKDLDAIRCEVANRALLDGRLSPKFSELLNKSVSRHAEENYSLADEYSRALDELQEEILKSSGEHKTALETDFHYARQIYGLINLDEFSSESISNPKFQAYLKSLPCENFRVPSERTIFKRFWQAVRTKNCSLLFGNKTKFFEQAHDKVVALIGDESSIKERSGYSTKDYDENVKEMAKIPDAFDREDIACATIVAEAVYDGNDKSARTMELLRSEGLEHFDPFDGKNDKKSMKLREYADKYGFSFYKTKEGGIFLSFRGTDNLRDLVWTDTVSTLGDATHHSRALRVAKWAQEQEEFKNKKVIVTGHSLGGDIAQYISIHTGWQGICINSKGTCWALRQKAIRCKAKIDNEKGRKSTEQNFENQILHLNSIGELFAGGVKKRDSALRKFANIFTKQVGTRLHFEPILEKKEHQTLSSTDLRLHSMKLAGRMIRLFLKDTETTK